MPKEYSIQHDGCHFTCYLKGKRAFCYKEDKFCTPRVEPDKYLKPYLASLSEELRDAYKITVKLVEDKQREPRLLANFLNYVNDKNYVYGSPRPTPMGVPNVVQVIPVEMMSDTFRWIDIIVTSKKLSPKVLDQYELTPLSTAAECFFKLSNLVRYGIARKEDWDYYYEELGKKNISPAMVQKDFAVMAPEYYQKRYKTNGRYATTMGVTMDLYRQMIETQHHILEV